MSKNIRHAGRGDILVTDSEHLARLSSSRRTWSLVRASLLIIRPIGFISVGFGLLALLGYLFNIEVLYRPLHLGPATNPLTAFCVILFGIALTLKRRPEYKLWLHGLLLTIISLTSLRMLDLMLATDFAETFTLFQQRVATEVGHGMNNSMGGNTALILWLLAMAMWCKTLYLPHWSQVFASIATLFPLASFTGYAYGIDTFYGAMSLNTALVSFMLTVAVLATTAHRGVTRALLSPYVSGKVARIQAIVAFLVPFAIGFLLFRTLEHNIDGYVVGTAVVFAVWFITLLVCSGTIFLDRTDRRRRVAERRLVSLATIDSLTGIANRRKLMDFGKSEMLRAQRSNHAFHVLMIDVDYFKRINDIAGHDIGDQVLRQVSHTIKRQIRSVDMVGRIGGEEFAVVLHEANAGGVLPLAEKIRSSIEAMIIPGWSEQYAEVEGAVTVSIGVGCSFGKNSFEQVLLTADKALYQAKKSGRNRIEVAPDVVPLPAC